MSLPSTPLGENKCPHLEQVYNNFSNKIDGEAFLPPRRFVIKSDEAPVSFGRNILLLLALTTAVMEFV